MYQYVRGETKWGFKIARFPKAYYVLEWWPEVKKKNTNTIKVCTILTGPEKRNYIKPQVLPTLREANNYVILATNAVALKTYIRESR